MRFVTRRFRANRLGNQLVALDCVVKQLPVLPRPLAEVECGNEVMVNRRVHWDGGYTINNARVKRSPIRSRARVVGCSQSPDLNLRTQRSPVFFVPLWTRRS